MQTALAPKFEPEFRLARPEDLDGILELYSQLHSSEERPIIDDNIKGIWNQILTDPRMFCFVIAERNRILSTCVLDIVPNLTRGARPFGVLQNVVTESDERGRGIGARLIREALQVAWKHNCYQVLVQTSQADAIPFYEKLGFRQDKVGLAIKPEWEYE